MRGLVYIRGLVYKGPGIYKESSKIGRGHLYI